MGTTNLQYIALGSVVLCVFLLVFQKVIRRLILSTLSTEDSYKVIRLILLLTWSVACIGLVAVGVNTYSDRSENKVSDLQVEVFLDRAWILLGGKAGLPRLYHPTTERAKLELARDEIEKALILNPGSTKALRYKSIYLNGIGRRDQAIELLRKLVKDHQDDDQILGELAGLLRQDGQLLKAGQLAEKAIRLHPSDPSLYSNLGITRSLEGRLRDAEAALSKAVALDSADATAHLYLADVLGRMGRIREAQLELEAALQLEPELIKTLRPEVAESFRRSR
jgi:tetratricopeptide (TPR) repeat protein